ncbi:hypothetical protein [Enterobacter sp. SA187]|uniref:hypothetical protein n=1 Tax=Enterobacter sp. SA187 TaxID=1914861 RepID=UPI000934DB7D|nr:hypothetical protein [Enterobacter sp. SA187]
MTLTRERLEEIRDYDTCVTLEESAEMARRLLAVEGQEPVAYLYRDKLHADARFSLEPRFGNWSPEDINEYEITETKLYASPQPAPVAQPELTVWYGAMPESNGKTNWTAILRRKDGGCRVFTIDCSEYPDRVRYEADRMRWMIGELPEEPDILAYDEHLHSGYVPPVAQPVQVPEPIKRNDADGWWMYKGRRVGGGCAEWYNRALGDWRAAMLKAEPVSQPYKLPEGWKLVPVEPTAEMISSGIAAHYERSQIQIHDRPAPGPMECAYVAMLAAAPQEPTK